jgi:GNAT superfamily N-acetyltransferase
VVCSQLAALKPSVPSIGCTAGKAIAPAGVEAIHWSSAQPVSFIPSGCVDRSVLRSREPFEKPRSYNVQMDVSSVEIRAIVEADWRDYRDLRLAMLEEIPIAFGETFDAATRVTDSGWRSRANRGSLGSFVRFAAIERATARWVGTMGGFLSPDDGNRPMLVGVYVVPEYRGTATGVTDALLARVEDWAIRFGDMLLLHVHEHNARAIAAYAKRGFVATGRTFEYSLDPSEREIEMVKSVNR